MTAAPTFDHVVDVLVVGLRRRRDDRCAHG